VVALPLCPARSLPDSHSRTVCQEMLSGGKKEIRPDIANGNKNKRPPPPASSEAVAAAASNCVGHFGNEEG
jgi:hypothetical protein